MVDKRAKANALLVVRVIDFSPIILKCVYLGEACFPSPFSIGGNHCGFLWSLRSHYLVVVNLVLVMFIQTLLQAGVPQELAEKCGRVLQREHETRIVNRTPEEIIWFTESLEYIK